MSRPFSLLLLSSFALIASSFAPQPAMFARRGSPLQVGQKQEQQKGTDICPLLPPVANPEVTFEAAMG